MARSPFAIFHSLSVSLPLSRPLAGLICIERCRILLTQHARTRAQIHPNPLRAGASAFGHAVQIANVSALVVVVVVV